MSLTKLLKEDNEEVTFPSYASALDTAEDTGIIYITESLSEMNGELLRQAKELAKPLGYKFFGYTIGGEVRVKKSELSKFIPIRHYDDLAKIV